jgi:hypothetical protein
MARYAARRREVVTTDGAAFLRAFEEARERVLRPILEEFAAELRRVGHEPRIAIDEAAEAPSIELVLGLRGADVPPGSNLVGFSVIRWTGAPEVLAYLVVRPPPMDLERFASPEEIDANQAEQMVLDAIEHVLACNAI